MTARPLLALALAATLVACGGDDDGDPGPQPVVVSVENNRFVPDSLDVDAGTAVTFRWAAGSVNHNVTPWASNAVALPASPGLPALNDAPFSFDVTFTQAETYRYFCVPHGSVAADGSLDRMAGVIRVR
jgi:plastocyanin